MGFVVLLLVRMATQSQVGVSDRTVRLWNAKTGEHLQTFDISFLKISFSPDWTMIASASFDNTVRLWDVKTGRTTTNT